MISTKTFYIFSLDWPDYTGKIDQRLLPFADKWKLIEYYKGHKVRIPPDWDSGFFPDRYFQVIKKPDDPNSDESENEVSLRIEGGWKGYDSEVIINLFISGKDVLSDSTKVSAEILKTGGADMILLFNNRQVTNFRKKIPLWHVQNLSKIWVDDMSIFL